MNNLEITATFHAPASRPVGLAWDGRFLWNADYQTGRLYALDPATFDIVQVLNNPGVPSGLAWDGRSLWQALMDEGWLRCTNPETGDFDRTIAVEEHGRLSGAAWDGAQLWVVSQQHGRLMAIDSESGQVTRSLPAPVAAGGLAYRNGALWLGAPQTMLFDPETGSFDWVGEGRQFFLLQLDAEDGRELARIPLDFLPMGLAWADDTLWLSETAAGRIHQARVRG